MLVATVRSPVAATDRVPAIVIVFAKATVLIVTVVLAGIITFVEEVGIPPHQLDSVFQSPEVPPIHVPVALTVRVAALLEVQPEVEVAVAV
jgi:hypothetical protein